MNVVAGLHFAALSGRSSGYTVNSQIDRFFDRGFAAAQISHFRAERGFLNVQAEHAHPSEAARGCSFSCPAIEVVTLLPSNGTRTSASATSSPDKVPLYCPVSIAASSLFDSAELFASDVTAECSPRVLVESSSESQTAV
jgi:hypothetical protein